MEHPATSPSLPIGSGSPRRRTGALANLTGFIGLLMVSVATVLSPTGFLGVTLCLLVPLGFGGLVVCAVGLIWRPRWPSILGLAIGLVCLAFWVGSFWLISAKVENHAARFGLTVEQHTHLCMAALTLTDAAESQRTAPGMAQATFTTAGLTPQECLDPWSHPCRYTLATTPRGYTFISDGSDGIPGTPDDIDLLTIQDGLTFQLPPIGAGLPPKP